MLVLLLLKGYMWRKRFNDIHYIFRGVIEKLNTKTTVNIRCTLPWLQDFRTRLAHAACSYVRGINHLITAS